MKIILTTITLLPIFTCAQTTTACSCFGRTSVCGSFMAAEAVFVGTVTRVENKMAKLDDGQESIAGQTAYVQVDESFKGAKAAELVFRSYGTSCDPVYQQGQRWLFYAYYNKKDKASTIAACDRSSLLDGASAAVDLLYLRALPAAAKKTRLAGVVMNDWHTPLPGITVKLIGERGTFAAVTDSNGVYEAYDVSAGKYVIEPQTASTIKLYMTMVSGDLSEHRRLSNRTSVAEKSCGGVDFFYKENTSLQGRVFGTDGLPLFNVCVSLMAKDKSEDRQHLFKCTNKEGRFKREEIALGNYWLVANDDGKLSSDEPFPATYSSDIDYKNCPKPNQLVSAYKNLDTNRIKLEANKNYENIELAFPFPYCARVKK